MSFDIDTSAQELVAEDTGAVVPILDVNEDPALDSSGQPVTITVAGMNSQRYRKVEAWQRKAMRAMGRAPSGEEQLTMQSEFVARCCLGWSGITSKGQPLAFTVENATSVFTKLPYVQRQVERAMSDRRFFSTASSA